MAQSDAYAASGGWGGGTPLTNNGGVLGSYMQKMQTVDPLSGSLQAAKPVSVNQQMPSLARVVNPATDSTPTIATTTPAPAANIPQVAAQTAAATTQALSGGLTGGVNGFGSAGAVQSHNLSNVATGPALTAHAQWSGPGYVNAVSPTDTNHYGLTYNPSLNKYQASDYSIMIANAKTPQDKAAAQAQQNAANAAADAYNASISPQLQAQAKATQDWQAQQAQNAATAKQQVDDAAARAAQQDAIDRAGAFNLAGGLVAPNTTAIDQSGLNDLNRVQSQYSSGIGGADGGFYRYAAQGDQSTQQAVNQVNHNTAYAQAYNQNYGTFTKALQAQQAAATNATGQGLAYSVQGIQQALTSLTDQASNLDAATKTKFDAQVLPLTNALAQYQNAVKQYGVDSSQAAAFAKALFSLGGSALAGAV